MFERLWIKCVNIRTFECSVVKYSIVGMLEHWNVRKLKRLDVRTFEVQHLNNLSFERSKFDARIIFYDRTFERALVLFVLVCEVQEVLNTALREHAPTITGDVVEVPQDHRKLEDEHRVHQVDRLCRRRRQHPPQHPP